MISIRHVAALFLLIVSICSMSAGQKLKKDDATERRIDALLQQMTLEEKVGQLIQVDGVNGQTNDLIAKGQVGCVMNVIGAEKTNALQRVAVEQSRLKIPLLIALDVIHGYRTIFPVPIGGASSFDPELLEQAERVAAKESSAQGVKWAFAPMIDISRDPRWGRMVEGSGEDPYLGSLIAAAKVRGFQGRNLADTDSVIACPKHYVGYGAAEGGRDYNSVQISDRLLREVYLPPFRAAIDAGAGTIMAAFDSLNGVPASANHYTLTDILRGEWGFEGMVDSDYNSVHELINHGIAKDGAEAATKAIMAGVDMDMVDNDYGKYLPSLVQSGKVPISVVDEAVRRVLRVKFAAGLFDRPYVDPEREKHEILTPENLQLARKLGQESLVLLKNQRNLLPLRKDIKTIAVIGGLADDKADQLGAWVGQGKAEDAVTPLEGIQAKVPNAKLLYEKGADIPSFEKGGINVLVAPAPVTATGVRNASNGGPASIENAVSAARKADVAILFLGELGMMSGEASSRATMNLPGKQQDLLEAVVATGKPVVLVLESGRPLDIRWAAEHVPAIVQAWFPGVQSGHAIADVLFGDVAPSGRMPITWPRHTGQIPVYYNHQPTGRPSSPDRWKTGYVDETSDPLFPFGYGLTYTTFKYGTPTLAASSISANGTLRLTAEIQNTGSRAATEVVQLYVRDRVAPTSRPVKELKGFSRVTLAPGESKKVEFSVAAKDLGSYDLDMKWIVPAGTYDVWVGPNSAEGEHTTFEVKGE